MEIFNCTYHALTIDKHMVLGIAEKLNNEDQVGELKLDDCQSGTKED
jgi:hypothetical protein